MDYDDTEELDADTSTDLDTPDPEDRPNFTPSFGLTGDPDLDRGITGPAIEMASLAHAVAMVPTSDAVIGEAMRHIQTIINVFGDKDKAIARYAEDLQSSLRLLFLELNNNPGRTLQRIIMHQEDPARRRWIITQVRSTLDSLEAYFTQQEAATND